MRNRSVTSLSEALREQHGLQAGRHSPLLQHSDTRHFASSIGKTWRAGVHR